MPPEAVSVTAPSLPGEQVVILVFDVETLIGVLAVTVAVPVAETQPLASFACT